MFDNLKKEYGTLAFLYALNTQSTNVDSGIQQSNYIVTEIKDCIIFPNTKADEVLLKGLNLDTQYGGVLAVNTCMALLPPTLTIRTIDHIVTESTKYQVSRVTKCKNYIYCILKSVDDLNVFDSNVESYSTSFRNKVYLDMFLKEIKNKVSTYTLVPMLMGQSNTFPGTFKEAGLNGFLTVSQDTTITYPANTDTWSVNFAIKEYCKIGLNSSSLELKIEDGVFTAKELYSSTVSTLFNTITVSCDGDHTFIELNGSLVSTLVSKNLVDMKIYANTKLCTYLYSDYTDHDIIEFNRRMGRTDD